MSTLPQTAPGIPLVSPWLDDGCADAVREQVASGFIGPGKTSERFAAELAERLGTASCTLTTSGTVALSVAAVACGLRPGDEILVPAYGVISTINAFASMGLRPRLVEIDRRTGCIDPEALRTRFSAATKAVCFVNFGGYTGENVEAVLEVAHGHGVPLIEDAATAIGHRHRGRSAGTFGDVGTLSFSPPKTITTGQGGAVLTASSEYRDAARRYVDHGDLEWRQTNLNREVGTNLRFNDVLAALGLAQLRTLDERLARKRRAYETMRELLGERMFSVPGHEAPLFNIVFSRRADDLVAELRARGIGATRQYRTIAQHPAFAHLADDSFPASDWWTNHTVYLPFGLSLSEDEALRVARAVLGSGIELIAP